MAQQWSTPSASSDIPNYLIPSIISVICCAPLAVVAIVFATQVNTKIAAGDLTGAAEASKKAKMFMLIAIGLGVLMWASFIILWIFVFGMAAISSF